MRTLLLLCLSVSALGADVQQRVIGGRDAFIGSYPYQLSLRQNDVHTCGASLIGTTRAVTSAQCTGAAMQLFSVLGGTANHTVTDCATCVLRNLNFLNRHPQYDEEAPGFPNDIAVLGFIAVTLNDYLDPVALASSSGGDLAGASCTITGWGQTSYGGALPNILQQAQMTVLTNAECESTWGSLRITPEHMCAFSSGISACSGDGGGPLVCSNALAGVTSWGEASCNPSYPYVFSRVSSFHAWILAQ